MSKKTVRIEDIPENHSFSCKHLPTGEEWYCIGRSHDMKRVCVAGWPPTIGDSCDCIHYSVNAPLTEEEMQHRGKTFGHGWT